MFSFFGLDKLAMYIFIGIALGGAVRTTYVIWKRNIEHQALVEFNQRQMEQAEKDRRDFEQRQEAIATQQAVITEQLAAQNQALSRRIESLNQFLASPVAQAADRPASDVLRRTLDQLRNGETQ